MGYYYRTYSHWKDNKVILSSFMLITLKIKKK